MKGDRRMKNSERFKGLVIEFLNRSSKYKNEINNFQRFLKDRMLEEKIFDLNVNHINEYFIYSYDTKIGAVPTLTTHISALKSLFDFLIQNDIGYFKSLYGYIDTAGFKERLSENLDTSFKKPVIDNSLLQSILYKMDLYISDNINGVFRNPSSQKRFFEVLICRLYAKISLILPVKPKEMLNLQLDDILNEQTREIKHNGITIKIPNKLRNDIIDTINFADNHYGKKYSNEDKLFVFLYSAIDKTNIKTSIFSDSFKKVYDELDIHEMLKQIPGGKKNKYVYPPESYKVTAILSMLNNGTNIVYLKKLTGLDMGALISNFDFEKDIQHKDVVSLEINRGIVSTDYYTYL